MCPSRKGWGPFEVYYDGMVEGDLLGSHSRDARPGGRIVVFTRAQPATAAWTSAIQDRAMQRHGGAHRKDHPFTEPFWIGAVFIAFSAP